jgi:hypothetical protein
MIKLFGICKFKPDIMKWEINEDIHDKLSLDVLSKIYSEAELRFNSTVDDITRLRTRAYSLVTVFISLLSILITMYFGEYLNLLVSDKKTLVLLYFVNLLLISYFLIQLVIIVFPNKIMLKGEEPKLMNYEGMATLSTVEQNKVYLFNSIQAIQEKIDFNESIVNNKTQRLESVIFLTTFMFVVTLSIELLIKLI